MVSYQSNFYWLRSMYPGGKWMVSLVPKLWLVKIYISWRQMSGQLLSLIWLVKWKCKWNVIGQISWSRKMKVLSYWSKYVWSVKVGENRRKCHGERSNERDIILKGQMEFYWSKFHKYLTLKGYAYTQLGADAFLRAFSSYNLA